MEQGGEVRDDHRVMIFVQSGGEFLPSVKQSLNDHRLSPRREHSDGIEYSRFADAVPPSKQGDASEAPERQPVNPPKPFDPKIGEAQASTLCVAGHGSHPSVLCTAS